MNRYRTIRYFAFFIEILVIFVIQETPDLIPAVYGARPVLLLSTVLSIAMFESEIPAMAFGVIGGLLMDYGAGSVLGFHALLLAAACYAVSIAAANLFQTNFIIAILISVIASAIAAVLEWFFFYLLNGYAYAGVALLQHYLPVYAYTAVFMPVCYFFNRALALQIRSKEE